MKFKFPMPHSNFTVFKWTEEVQEVNLLHLYPA